MIQLYHVSKRYENGANALTDVSLRVREGEFVFLTGSSGAGKSTLLRLLLVMERVSEGQVLIGGRNVHVLRDASVPYLRRNIGLVFQDFKLVPRRTVFENVAIAMEILGLAKPEIERRVMQLLTDLGLQHKARSIPSTLSGGEQQRVALARALANEPAILLADEPTGNLDPQLSVEIMDLLLEINRRGTTVVVATHDYALVKRYGLRVIHIEHGRIAEDRARTHPAEEIGASVGNVYPPVARHPIGTEASEVSPITTAAARDAKAGQGSGEATDNSAPDPLLHDEDDQRSDGQDVEPPPENAAERADGIDAEKLHAAHNQHGDKPKATRPFRNTFTSANVRVDVGRITGPVTPHSGAEVIAERNPRRRR